MSDVVQAVVATKGHPFEREPFLAMLDALDGVECTHVEHPDVERWFDIERSRDIDAFVFYDMPGIEFTRSVPPVRFVEPPRSYVEGFERLLADGKGLVFLHHAIAGWPAWPAYADLVGGRFHYQPASLHGVDYPDSGYLLDVTHTIEVVDPAHPICAGLPASFELTDELYCAPVLSDTVVPLLRTTFPVDDPSRFFSADLAIRGRRNSNEGWTHPSGSNLIAWVKHARRSPVAYVQPGDGPTAYGDPTYRRLLANAIRWVASPEARAWASERSASP